MKGHTCNKIADVPPKYSIKHVGTKNLSHQEHRDGSEHEHRAKHALLCLHVGHMDVQVPKHPIVLNDSKICGMMYNAHLKPVYASHWSVPVWDQLGLPLVVPREESPQDIHAERADLHAQEVTSQSAI